MLWAYGTRRQAKIERCSLGDLYFARRSLARSRPSRSAHAGDTRRDHFLSGSCRSTGASEHMSTQSTGITATLPSASCSRSDSRRASYASRAPARVQQPPTQNCTTKASFRDDFRRHSSHNCANAGPPQTTLRSFAEAPHIGQDGEVRACTWRFIARV